MSSLPLTGERTLPGIAEENYWFRRHEAAYLALAPLVEVGRLVEVGAGEGYGTALLAERAEFSCAIDYDPAAIGHLAGRYAGLNPVRANLAALPVGTDQVDIVVSLQVIEHVWDHRQFLDECARVLRPGGSLLLSTPNRLTFSPDARAGDRPANPFHTHEFTAAELLALVGSAGFTDLRLRGLHPSDRLIALDERYRASGGFVAAQLAGPAASWPVELAAEVASVTAADFAVSDAAPDASLDLIVLARSA
ncbi:MAG: methyltransferase domain-containing protein [Jatrophihabitantaceae bacterium]